MDNENTAKRRKLFRQYAKNLKYFMPELSGQIFLCPICMRSFVEWQVENPDIQPAIKLTLGHLWPSSTGGSLETLECKRCNNRLGTQSDSQVILRERQWTGITSPEVDKGWPATVHFGDHKASALVSVEGETVRLYEQPHHSKDGEWEKIIAMSYEANEFAGKIKMKSAKPTRVKIAFLHAAYLTAFYQFGYDYVLRAETQWIREILGADHPPATVDVPCFYHKGTDDNASGTDFTGRIFFGKTDKEEHCVVAVFPNPEPERPLCSVLLPGFGVEAIEEYQRLQQRTGGKNISIHLIERNPPDDRLVSPKECDHAFGTEMWLRWTKRTFLTSHRPSITFPPSTTEWNETEVQHTAEQIKLQHPEATHFAVLQGEGGVLVGRYDEGNGDDEAVSDMGLGVSGPRQVYRLDQDGPVLLSQVIEDGPNQT